MSGSPVFLAVVLGVIGIVSLLVVLRTLGARLERKKRFRQLEERIEALPADFRAPLRERMARYREKARGRGSGPRQRNARWEQFVTRKVGEAEEMAKIHESLLLLGRISRMERRLSGLPEEARFDVEKRLRSHAHETLSRIRDEEKREASRDRYATIVMTMAEVTFHLPLDRRLVLQTRFEALPRNRQERILSALSRFAVEGLSPVPDAKARAGAWEIRYEELLNEAEDEDAAEASG